MSHAKSINDLKCSMQPWKLAVKGPIQGREIATKAIQKLQDGVNFLRDHVEEIPEESKDLCASIILQKMKYYKGCLAYTSKERKPNRHAQLTAIVEDYGKSIQKLKS